MATLHAVEGERADYDTFRATIADLEASFANEPSQEVWLAQITTA
jgi:hypothetical protein